MIGLQHSTFYHSTQALNVYLVKKEMENALWEENSGTRCTWDT